MIEFEMIGRLFFTFMLEMWELVEAAGRTDALELGSRVFYTRVYRVIV